MTTVGYGDVYAISPFGRSISIMNALWGMTLISLFATTLSQFIELSENQKKALAEICQNRSSARLVRAGISVFLAKADIKKYKTSTNPHDYVFTDKDLEKFK